MDGSCRWADGVRSIRMTSSTEPGEQNAAQPWLPWYGVRLWIAQLGSPAALSLARGAAVLTRAALQGCRRTNRCQQPGLAVRERPLGQRRTTMGVHLAGQMKHPSLA